ncbi:hypothetical protein M8818_003069 [Zalaria obscura]|uniref:Uncharacterized protein n=1 Tax=Zalaria obscura TaxID=2024903 RepID=A0ACC3SGR3_9PEZI
MTAATSADDVLVLGLLGSVEALDVLTPRMACHIPMAAKGSAVRIGFPRNVFGSRAARGRVAIRGGNVLAGPNPGDATESGVGLVSAKTPACTTRPPPPAPAQLPTMSYNLRTTTCRASLLGTSEALQMPVAHVFARIFELTISAHHPT